MSIGSGAGRQARGVLSLPSSRARALAGTASSAHLHSPKVDPPDCIGAHDVGPLRLWFWRERREPTRRAGCLRRVSWRRTAGVIPFVGGRPCSRDFW